MLQEDIKDVCQNLFSPMQDLEFLCDDKNFSEDAAYIKLLILKLTKAKVLGL